jgi:hypothetical protein
VRTQFVDARYSWCHLRGMARADYAATALAFDAAAAARGLRGRAAFVEADLLAARDVARRLDHPVCAHASAIHAMRSDEPAGHLLVPFSHDVNKTAHALAELLAPPVAQLVRVR